MRDICSGCGESYLDEHMDTCECGRNLCIYCLQTHMQSAGHMTITDRQLAGNGVPSMKQVITAEDTAWISRRLNSFEEVGSAVVITGPVNLSVIVFWSHPPSADKRLDIRISYRQYQDRLSNADSREAMWEKLVTDIMTDLANQVRSKSSEVPDG